MQATAQAITTTASIALLVWMLSAAPFVHSHAGAGHDGAVVHSHLPEQSPAATAGPALEHEDHDGISLDLFASIPGPSQLLLVCVDACFTPAPAAGVSFEDWTDGPRRQRGPPRSTDTPRAPPA